MQDPNNPDDEEFFDDEFAHEFDDLESFDEEMGETAPAEFSDDPVSDDTDALFEDDQFMEANWDDFDQQAEGTAGRKSNKLGGRGLSFNTIVIGVAVIVGLGVLAYQVVSTPAPGSGASRFQSVLDFTGSTDGPVLGEAPTPETGQNVPEQETATQGEDTGFLNDPGLLDAPEQDAADMDALPMPSPISNDIDEEGMQQEVTQQDDILTPLPDLSFNEAESVPRGPDDPLLDAPVEDEVSSPALDVIRRAQTQQQAAQEPVAEAPVVEPEEAPVDRAASDADDTPVEPVDDVPAEPAPEMVQPPAPMEAQAPAPTETDTSANSATSQAILEKLETLSDRLSVMEQQIVQLRESGRTDLDEMEKEIATLKRGVEAASPSDSSSASAPKKEAPKAQAAPAPKRETSKPAPRAPASTGPWELRAAQPGRAWVSRPGSREMQSVVPGDSLSGIGQVVRIDYAGGRWTVVGTQGQIRQ